MGVKRRTRRDGAHPSAGALLIEGLEEVAAIERGELKPARVRRYHLTARDAKVGPPPGYDAQRIAALRRRLKLSQAVFAAALNVSVATVRSWEQGVREPDGPSRRLLQIVDEHPETVLSKIA
jgi:DNA-binding transcriptional regulator YiaG